MDRAGRDSMTMGLVRSVLVGGVLISTWIRTGNLIAIALTSAVALYFVSSATLGALTAWLPERFPLLVTRSRPPWRLRLPQTEAVVSELRGLGFVDVGTNIEHAWIWSVPSRVLWSAEHGTYATIFSFMFVPQLSFLSFDGRKVLHTTRLTAPGRHRSLVIERGAGSLQAQLAQHVASAAREGMVSDPSHAPRSKADFDDADPNRAALLQRRLEATRHYYLARFATDADYARTIGDAAAQQVT
jgi:hypothetical protein